jgi:biopolymer transport protein ExbB
MMIPIIACSVLVMVFTIERGMALRRARVAPPPFVKRVLHQVGEAKLDRDAALKLCLENKSPVALMFAAGVRKWGKPAVEVEQAVLDAGERAANGLRKYLRVFSGVATVSPLLGLLGTVLGMIQAFNDIASASAMGRPDLLASGISQALLTTAGGLLVAIPALVGSLFFVSRVDALIVELDRHGEQLVGLISAEGPRGNAARGARREAA